MRIEITGPPTSGKSRLVKAFKKTHAVERGPRGNIDKIPRSWRGFADFIRRAYAPSPYVGMRDKTLRALASAWLASRPKAQKRFFVFDELVIVAGFSMAIRLPEEHTITYLHECPMPEFLIILDAPLPLLLERNQRRGEGDRPEKTVRSYYAHKKYLPLIKKRKCVILKYNTAHKSSDDIAKSALAKIREAVRHGRVG